VGYEVELWAEGKYFLTIFTKQKTQESGITCEDEKKELNWHLGHNTCLYMILNFYISAKNNVCIVEMSTK